LEKGSAVSSLLAAPVYVAIVMMVVEMLDCSAENLALDIPDPLLCHGQDEFWTGGSLMTMIASFVVSESAWEGRSIIPCAGTVCGVSDRLHSTAVLQAAIQNINSDPSFALPHVPLNQNPRDS
jgi:hypothetical protein